MPGTTRRSRSWLSLVIVVPIALAAGAGDVPAPRSAKARTALRKYDRAVEKARGEYDAAVAAATKVLAAELDEALKAAMKAGSLEEANSIKAAKESRATGKTPRAAASLDGKWSVVSGNDTTRTYVFDGTALRWTQGGRTHDGSVKAVDGAFLVDTGDGKLERLTLVNERFFIEHFNPAQTYPAGVPDEFGLGTRAAEK
jgi:hypothetical protein